MVKAYLRRFVPYYQLPSGLCFELESTLGRVLFYEGNAASGNVQVKLSKRERVPKGGATQLEIKRLGRYLSLCTPPSGAWRDWLISCEKGPGSMVEATEAKYAKDDMDACVMECLLPDPVNEGTHADPMSFSLPVTNEVLLLTRWGSVVHAPVAPETAQQTQLMADGEQQEAGYSGRDTFVMTGREVDLAGFRRRQFTSLQACRVAAEAWQYCHSNLDAHREYPTFPGG